MISRRIYVFFLYYLVLEGAFRKWVWPEISNELFLLKDLLLVFAVGVLYAIERSRLRAAGALHFAPLEGTLFQIWVVIAFIGAAATGFSLTGVIGLRYYLIPLLVFLVHPVLARTPKELEGFFDGYLALCFVICCLGFVQVTSGQDALINRYSWAPNSDIDVATFGEVADRGELAFVRVTGTFSYISPYASYLQFMYFVALGMFLMASNERMRVWYAVLIAGILANLFMTGSRGPTVGCLLIGLLFVPQLKKALGGKFAFFGLFFGVLAMGAGIWLARDIIDALIARNQAAGDADVRVSSALFFPYSTVVESSFWGEGVGATFLGLGQLTGAGGIDYRFDEVLQDRLAVEVGVLGYIFFLVFKVYFLIATWQLVRRSESSSVRVWALVSFAYQASLGWIVPMYNSVAMTFYVFSISLYAWLKRFDVGRSSEQSIGSSAMAYSKRT
jgi:hypothetical protein